jgi:hypothetical protein
MYRLTLTQSQRQAFDWVSDRYNSGKVSDLLIDCLPEDIEWCDGGDITFLVPEHVAWEIKELAEEEDRLWPGFSDRLRNKLNTFLDTIV